MRKACLLVATHHRPDLLRLCLLHAKNFVVPDGWEFSIVVGANREDKGVAVAKGLGCVVAVAQDTKVTDKFAAALRDAPEADLYLMSGDDDLHCATRLQDSIALWEQGHKWIANSSSWYVELPSKRVARWEGLRKGRLGTFYAFDGALLREKGWPSARKSADQALIKNLGLLGTEPALLPAHAAWQSVCLAHSSSIDSNKPFPRRFQSVRYGAFLVTGYAWEDLPLHIRQVLDDQP